MSRVYLGIGSNQDPHRHVTQALEALSERVGPLNISPVYESEPVGFVGRNFLNLVAEVETGLSVGQLRDWLKQLEDGFGRKRDGTAYGRGALDIDILTYDDHVGIYSGVHLPRPEIVANAFVLQPLADIAAERRHPSLGLTYGELWASYAGRQKLWRVPFTWRGLEL